MNIEKEKELKNIIIEQQQLILLLRNKISRIRGKFGFLLNEVEF